jgi:hypothetical protein
VTPETNIRDHIEDSLLLAHLRRQKLDDEVNVRITRHIEVEGCLRCRHKLDHLAQVSTILEVLGPMPSYQHYPEMSVAETYAHVLGAASKETSVQADLGRMNNRQRPRKSALRLVSLPAAIALAILFSVIVIVFASLLGRPGNSQFPKIVISTSPNNSTSIVPHESTPTPNLALTATVSATAAVTPTATPITGPYIEVCSTPPNIAHWRLVICGHNFEAGYKVTLFAFGKTLTRLPNLLVNKQGNFQGGWTIDNCGNLPTIIFASEKANAKPIYVGLQDIAFGKCALLTPTVGPSGTQPGI